MGYSHVWFWKGLCMKAEFVSILVIAILGMSSSISNGFAADHSSVPILVELFTSEGCSSCPPADTFLQKLDGQPISGAELIVLSEHVDYWNHNGWKDPYSSSAFTERQNSYSTRFHLDSIHTPQMVVDGSHQFSGGDAKEAQKAITESLGVTKIPVRISEVSSDGGRLRAHLETGPLDSSYHVQSVEIYVAVALNHAESQVLRGENANRRLTHTAVVKKLSKVGKIKVGEQFAHDVELKLDSGTDLHNMRVVAFLQDAASGKIVGATMKTADAAPSALGGTAKSGR
jgi:hypothetical protein